MRAKEWKRPKLLILVKSDKGEQVLEACKVRTGPSSVVLGPTIIHVGCRIVDPCSVNCNQIMRS